MSYASFVILTVIVVAIVLIISTGSSRGPSGGAAREVACRQCGTAQPGHARFCRKCGKPLG